MLFRLQSLLQMLEEMQAGAGVLGVKLFRNSGPDLLAFAIQRLNRADAGFRQQMVSRQQEIETFECLLLG